MPPFVFSFPATIDRWIDGDSCVVHRGATPGVEIHGEHVRVQGINAPEMRDAGGAAARDFAVSLAPPGSAVTLICTKPDKYGRLLARIVLPDGLDLSELMINAGHAVAYMV